MPNAPHNQATITYSREPGTFDYLTHSVSY
jgi:hypothetical protein